MIQVFALHFTEVSLNGFERDFELELGEFVTVSKNGFERKKLVNGRWKAFCAFEFAYFARPDFRFDDIYVYEIREEFGCMQLMFPHLLMESLNFRFALSISAICSLVLGKMLS